MTLGDQLPNNPALLKELLDQSRVDLHCLLEQHTIQIEQITTEHAIQIEQINTEHAVEVTALAVEVNALKTLVDRIREEASDQMEQLRLRMEAEKIAAVEAIWKRFYGPRSEKFDPRQLLLFGTVVDEMPLDEANVEAQAGEPCTTRRARHKHGRQQLPEGLPRVEIDHDLSDEEKLCPSCSELRHKIGEERSSQLEITPARFKVLVHVRHTYACHQCEQAAENPQIVTAKMPLQPIDKGLPGPGLIAYVVTSKLGDHLPLYRLENIFAREDIHIARSTMCAWMQAAGEIVTPLVDLMTNRVRLSDVIHTDETTIPVQEPGKCKSGRIWTYIGDMKNPYVVYDYTPNRKRDGPATWLKGYRGYLQADAYGGYDGIYHGGQVIEVACWAHARRYFFERRGTDPKRADHMLKLVGGLYGVERRAKESNLSDEDRLALRIAESVPILDQIKAWLDAELQVVLPRSPMAGAMKYVLNQWNALRVYATRGSLSIDNNAAERALKRVAIGRKNWMFVGREEVAQVPARLWSLIASAERHGLDPQRYLTSVFAKIRCTPASELDQFLPEVWKREAIAEGLIKPGK